MTAASSCSSLIRYTVLGRDRLSVAFAFCALPCPPLHRYLDFMSEHLKEVCNYELKPELRGELETAILHLEVSWQCQAHALLHGPSFACALLNPAPRINGLVYSVLDTS